MKSCRLLDDEGTEYGNACLALLTLAWTYLDLRAAHAGGQPVGCAAMQLQGNMGGYLMGLCSACAQVLKDTDPDKKQFSFRARIQVGPVACRAYCAGRYRCGAAAAQWQHQLLPRRSVTGTRDAPFARAAGGQSRALDQLAQRRLPHAAQVSGHGSGCHAAPSDDGCSTRGITQLEDC